MKKIAIVISIYKNVSLPQLEEMFNSIYQQTLGGDIFIKVDGEVSNTITLYLQKNRKKFKYLDFRKENKGIPISYNELFEKVLALGYEYIARMDADDIMMPKRLELQYSFMEQNKEIDVVGGYIEEFGDNLNYKKIVKYPLTHDEMFKFFSKRVPLANVTSFFRRSFFEKAGLYPVSSSTNEDTLLWMKGFQVGCRFANIPEVLVRVRVNNDFFDRRGGLKKAWSDLQDRFLVIKTLNYSKISYFYAIGVMIIHLLPSKLKKIAYKYLR